MASAIGEPDGSSAPAGAAPGAGRARWGLLVGVAVAVIVVDQLSKAWAVDALAGRDIDLVWTLRLHLERNAGTAFSFGAGTGWARWLPLAALAVVAVLAWQSRAALGRLGAVAMGLILGGALSNIGDRVFRAGDAGFFQGRVVDFIDVQWWPVWNVADASVVVGGLLLVLATLRVPPDAEADPDDASGVDLAG